MSHKLHTDYLSGMIQKNILPDTRLIFSGGTIDSEWDSALDTVTPRSNSIIPSYLKNFTKYYKPLAVEQICMRDSRNLDSKQQKAIIQAVLRSPQQNIIVTAGTYCMSDIASLLKDNEAFSTMEHQKKVIFTGSFTPLSGFEDSDGGFALGMSFSLFDNIQNPLPNGAWVVVNGQCIEAGKVIKNIHKSEFIATNPNYNFLKNFTDFDVISTGGTIDFEHNGLDGMSPAKESHTPIYFKKVNLQQDVNFYPTILKDSRHINEKDMELLKKTIKSSPSKKILITCGIYNYKAIQNSLMDISDKTIVITGSRFPLKNFVLSDAQFNLGYAAGKLATLPKGVYFVFGGKIIENTSEMRSFFTSEELANIV